MPATIPRRIDHPRPIGAILLGEFCGQRKR